MQKISAALQAALDLGQVDPRILVDLYEFYDYNYIPGVNGFAPIDAIERFAAEEITWNGFAYRRELKDRTDIIRSMGEKTNNVTLNFSNISRYMATLAQSQEIEGLFLVIRCVAPSVTDDSLVLFVGRCEKPSDIDKKSFSLTARQDFGNINQAVPPRRFEIDDPEGRLPSDSLYEGINLIAIGGSLTFPRVEPSTSFFGRLFGRRKTVQVTQQWSSTDSTPFGDVVPEIFGRCQVELIPIAWADKGSHVGYLMVISNGPITAVTDLKSRTQGLSDPLCSFATPPAPAVVHLGDPGGTGTNNGNTCQADLAGGRLFSRLAYIEGASLASDPEAAVAAQDDVPVVTALVKGRIIPLPNNSGVYNQSGWTDNPVHIARFILTDSKWVNINPAFMEDAVNYQTALHCDYPLVDETNTQVIPVVGPDINQAGDSFQRFLPTGNITPRRFLYNDFGDTSIIPEFEDGPYVGVDLANPLPDPSNTTDPSFISQKPLRKRYTANFPITEEIRAVDLLHKILFPTAKLFMRVNKFGRYEIRSEQPSDATRLRTATSIGATSIPLLDVTPWKSGPDLLQGRVLLGFGLTTSEVRTPSAAVYSSSGNSVTLAVSQTGGVTILASGATLTGGSTTVQASGTITIGGTPAAGNTITATIDGIAVTYTLASADTTGTAAAMLSFYINANQRLNKYIRASWAVGTPTVITITCLHGALTVPELLKAHTVGIADPSSAPTVAAAVGSLASGTYKLAYADVTATGSTALTPLASIVLTANQQINVSGLPALVGTSREFYVSEKANSTNLRYVATRTDSANFSINSLPLAGAAIPPSHNTTSEELIRVAKSFATNSQDVYPAWAPSTTVLLNDVYLPTILNGHKYKVTTAGTTGATEPSWPTGDGATVASGTAVFTEFGSTVLQQAGLVRANVKKDSFKWPLGSRQSSVNQVKGNFRDAKNDFALTPFKYNDRTHQGQVKKIFPIDIDLSAVDSVHQVARIAGWVLSKNREGDWFNSLATGPDGLVLEEGDVICSSDDSGGLINVVTRIEDLRIQPNHDVVINQARRYSTLMFSDDVGAHRIPVASTLKFAQTKNSLVTFIDTPAFKTADGSIPGFYIAVNHDLSIEGDWRGWSLYADFGDGYTFVAEGDVPASMGTATTTLGTVTSIDTLDTVNQVTFTLDYVDAVPGFSTVTQADLVANPHRNLFQVGGEMVQATTIVDNGNRSFTISGLLRGRFNTDSDELVHAAGERVVFINGAEQFIPMDLSRLNTPYNYKLVTTNQDVVDATAVSFTWTGKHLLPKRPTGIVVYRDTKTGALANQMQTIIPVRNRVVGEAAKFYVDVFSATAGPAFTVDASTDIFTSTAHGLVAGDTVALSTTGTLPAPLHKNNHYYLRDITTNTFKLSASSGGAAINLLNTGSGIHKFTRRVRHIPVQNFGAFNPAVITIFTPSDTPPTPPDEWQHATTTGSGGWDSTITTEWTGRNNVIGSGPGAAGGGISAAALEQISEPGAEVEFTLGTVAYNPALETSVFLTSPEFAVDGSKTIYREMRFTVFTDAQLPTNKAGSRRWKLTIHERISGVLTLVYTDPDFELPDMRYRMQLSGTELRYYRDYGGPNSTLLYRSTIPLVFPLRVRADVATAHSIDNVKLGGLPECITTYPDTDMISDFGTQPSTVRFRVYEEKTLAGVTLFGDATDFIT